VYYLNGNGKKLMLGPTNHSRKRVNVKCKKGKKIGGDNQKIFTHINKPMEQIHSECDKSILQAKSTTSVLDANDGITYIHFREIPKDGLKNNHIEIILGPERATRPGVVKSYGKIIQERKTALRIWGIAEVIITRIL
jgi:hypothetical protein